MYQENEAWYILEVKTHSNKRLKVPSLAHTQFLPHAYYRGQYSDYKESQKPWKQEIKGLSILSKLSRPALLYNAFIPG